MKKIGGGAQFTPFLQLLFARRPFWGDLGERGVEIEKKNNVKCFLAFFFFFFPPELKGGKRAFKNISFPMINGSKHADDTRSLRK